MALASQMARNDRNAGSGKSGGSGGPGGGGFGGVPWWIIAIAVVVILGIGVGVAYEIGWLKPSEQPVAVAPENHLPPPSTQPAPPPSVTFGLPKPPGTPGSGPTATPAPTTRPSVSMGPTPTLPGGRPATLPAATRPASTQPTTQLSESNEALRAGMKLIESGQLVQGRAKLTGLLFGAEDDLRPLEAQTIRDTLNSVNQELFFSPKVFPGDSFSALYEIQAGDFLSRLAPKYQVTYQLLEAINRVDSRKMYVGRKIKLVRGPLHVIVHKSKFLMDVYGNASSGEPVLIRSFVVGLGESNSTPVGHFYVKNKVANPGWSNPRTGETFQPNDPKNPIGHFWVGLEGADASSAVHKSYGIHGTIDPDSVGKQMSMGCIRLRDADIELVYKMLVEKASSVVIQAN